MGRLTNGVGEGVNRGGLVAFWAGGGGGGCLLFLGRLFLGLCLLGGGGFLVPNKLPKNDFPVAGSCKEDGFPCGGGGGLFFKGFLACRAGGGGLRGLGGLALGEGEGLGGPLRLLRLRLRLGGWSCLTLLSGVKYSS